VGNSDGLCEGRLMAEQLVNCVSCSPELLKLRRVHCGLQ
jgi:hypothetical protein